MDFPPITSLLVVVNGIFTYMGFTNPQVYAKYLFHTGSIRHNNEYYRLVTSGFLHADWAHLLFNMFSLFSFCRVSEGIIGPIPTLIIYIGSLIIGNLITLMVNYRNDDYHAVGASGAVSGMIFSGVLLMPDSRMGLLLFPVMMPAWVFALVYIGFSMYGMKSGRDNIGHEAHLGGALGGVLLTVAIFPEIIAMEPLLFAALVIPCVGVLAWGALRRR
ncbi:MAG: rhomboid family intramembrane serine protease [Ignavibacteriae bacterium]|nr:rhomboid family intramembrane serine protease [Ignavibacteriota bacterium]